MRRPPAVALVFAAVASAATLFFLLRQGSESPTPEAVAAALARWKREGPRAYDMVVVVEGAQPAEHRVSVRNGVVVGMTTDGVPVPQHVWPYWSVDGMLEIVAEEARRACEQHANAVLRVEFDATHGFPKRFLRHTAGDRTSIEWRVEEFTPR